MCGICGIVGAHEEDDISRPLEQLTEALHHRGPDGGGIHYFRGRSAGLGHRRLSIVDLALGAQPMSGEDGRIWVSYNGEIYNYRALRAELVQLGYAFRTNADTEVVVQGFAAWGPKLFGRLNGIYAFALYDGRSDPGDLWLVRDPAGVKPLYLGRHRGAWWFASELDAARTVGCMDTDLRLDALDEYLVYRFIPSPGTPFRNTWKLPPGYYCRIPLDRLPEEPRFERFETNFEPAVLPKTDDEWAEALRSGLAAAVERQLMSDVPVGVLLSGGVDSTAVSSVMRDRMPEPPQAFAVGFRGQAGVDELQAARASARALGLPLREVEVTSESYLEAWLRDVVSRVGEPISDYGSLLVALLCQEVRKTHKVVLTGQGADEPLGGYARHFAERLYPAARRLGPLLDILPERAGASDRVARTRRMARVSDRAQRFTEIMAVFAPSEVASLTGRNGDVDRFAAPVRRWLVEPANGDSLNALLTVDARLSLADNLLLLSDHMAMASSVEMRVPFLDLEFLALLERMPSRLKVSRFGDRKWLYRRSVAPLIPAELREPLLGRQARTGRKLGFSVPIEAWFKNWIQRDAESFLLGPEARLPQVMRADRLKSYLEMVRARRLSRSRQLMALFVLESWLRGPRSTGPLLSASRPLEERR
ncbi:MAG TPA: asparagine synthase (glutamine-hydrolyzing) [Candidatus Eisenbacteria bacterium]|nr:asparagine synthase (glutamine-hydrolyzing) [Candidatus Eisenbacteria bacterium]